MPVESPMRLSPQKSPRRSPQKSPQKPCDRVSIALRQFSGQINSNATFDLKQRTITINNSTFQIPNFFSHHDFHVEHVLRFLRPTIEPFYQNRACSGAFVDACVIGFGAARAGTSWSLGSRPGSNGAIVAIFKRCSKSLAAHRLGLKAWLYNAQGAECGYEIALKSSKPQALQLFLETVETKKLEFGCDHVLYRFTKGEAQLTIVDLGAPSGAAFLQQSLSYESGCSELVAILSSYLAWLPVAVLGCVRDGGTESEEIARVLERVKCVQLTGALPRPHSKTPRSESIEVDDFGVWMRRQLSSMPAVEAEFEAELEVPEPSAPGTPLKALKSAFEPIKFPGFSQIGAVSDAPAAETELRSENRRLKARNAELTQKLAALLESQPDWDSDDEYLDLLERPAPQTHK